MALPAMAAIRAAMAGRQLIVAASPGVAPLFEELTIASPDAIAVVDSRNEAAQVRGLGAGAIVLLTNSFRTAWVSRRAGIPQRWGYRAHARSLLLTRAIAKPRRRVHQSEYYLHLVSELGLNPVGLGARGSGLGTRGSGLVFFEGSDPGLTPGRPGSTPLSRRAPSPEPRAPCTIRRFASPRRRAPAPTPCSPSSASTARRLLSDWRPGRRTATPSAGRRSASPRSSRA